MIIHNKSIKYVTFLMIITYILTVVSFVNAQERNYTVKTIAGNLIISSEPDEPDCIIKLDRRIILTDPCSYSPYILKHIKQKIAPFDEVIVFQNQMSGNLCSGMDIFFLGIKKSKEYEISDSIEYCGGPPPTVSVGKNKITITLPRFKSSWGQVWTSKETWLFETGKIRQVKQPKSRGKRD